MVFVSGKLLLVLLIVCGWGKGRGGVREGGGSVVGGVGGRWVVGVGVVGGSGGVTSPAEEFRACVGMFLGLDQYPP